jgi:hypothetical protein
MSEADLVMTDGGLTDASSWMIAAGSSVTLRRNAAASRSARPLTRYLPVTGQENFDLRAHIESAGHQVGLLFRSGPMFVFGFSLVEIRIRIQNLTLMRIRIGSGSDLNFKS